MQASCSVIYSSVHNACAMSPDGVGNVSDVDGIQVLVVGRPLYKYLHKTKHTNKSKISEAQRL